MGIVDAVDRTYVLCGHLNCPLVHHILCRVFWQNIKSPRWLRPPTIQDLAPCNFWLFPKLKSALRGKRFQLIRVRKIGWGSWWWLGELCEVPSCLLWRGLRHHCPMYHVSCILFDKYLYFAYYVAGYFLDRTCKKLNLSKAKIDICFCLFCFVFTRPILL